MQDFILLISMVAIFRGHQQAKILTFDELLEMYPNKYINVDLKDTPSSYEGAIAPKNV